MKKKYPLKMRVLLLVLLLSTCLLSGCAMQNEEMIKLRDLDFTVLSDEKIPVELKKILDEKKETPFQITYSDNQNLYICVGYGCQQTGGYSIAVNELYLTEKEISVNTCLLGPQPSEQNNQIPSYPYIVLKIEYLDKPVVFQ